jgi:hypothetical protein
MNFEKLNQLMIIPKKGDASKKVDFGRSSKTMIQATNALIEEGAIL